jgi:apoptosis-inducing factor 3
MSEAEESANGPDFRQGIVAAELADGAMLLGHVGEAPALLVRRGPDLLAIGATCTHYGGPLAAGLIVGDTVRCPWHHACFSLRTGAALRPPALNGLPCWRVEQRDGMAFVREELQLAAPQVSRPRRRCGAKAMLAPSHC